MIGQIAALAAAAIAVGGSAYDITQTVKGIKAGIASEGNTFLVGSKPSAKALILRDTLMALIFVVPSVVTTLIVGGSASFLLAAPVAFGGKHYLGGRKWAKITGMTPEERVAYLNRPLSAWQKFLGE